MARFAFSALASLLVVVLLVTQEIQAHEVQPQAIFKGTRSLLSTNVNCPAACNYRCSKANAHENCIKYCNICCRGCNCVPPGTYGNKEVCPCYANWKNSKGGSKCP